MEQDYNLRMDHVDAIERDMKKLAHELYKNPRVARMTITLDTLMGTSITYTTLGDPDAPLCKALVQKEIQDAIQNIERPAPSYTEAPAACPRDIPGGLQQWMGTD